jgi:signal peptidase
MDVRSVQRTEIRAAARFAGRFGRIMATWLALGLGAGLLLTVTLPYVFGYRSLTVLSGSMEPTLHVGDVVVVSEISPLDARIGDVVSFRDPADSTRLITHRVRSIQRSGTYVEFVTKGDANTSVEHWKVTQDATIGLVHYRVWRIGYALFYFRGRFGRLFLVVIPALLLGVYEIVRIWRPQPEDGSEEELAGESPA